ncbi:MAG: hypothetical protein ACREVB_14465 [Burkholderiales bacterium]
MLRAELALLLALAGCAGLDQNTCASADWYELGFRDAIFSMQRQDEVYSHQCGKIDVARYAQGWQEGRYEHDRRRSHRP